MFHLESYITTPDTNFIEIYYIKQQDDGDTVDILVEPAFVEEFKSKYKNWKTTKYISYHKNHLTYLYDLTDDNQIAYTKISQLPKKYKSTYIIPYKYSKVPVYMFPCINDIDYVCEYTLTSTNLTNRISLVIRNDEYGNSVYIEYKHSPNVDIEKIEDLLRKLI
jgi:hypothetical protein